MTHTDANNPPKPRENHSLGWLVVDREGKLLAILDSESEACHYEKGRAHAEGGRYFKAPLDYAAAPKLLAALRGMLAAWPYIECNETRAARAAITEAEGSAA